MKRQRLSEFRRPSPGCLQQPPSLRERGVFAAAVTLLLIAGCATYPERTLKLHNAYYDNQLAVAGTEVDLLLKRERANADLVKLDAAMIDLAAGEQAKAERIL